MAELSLLAALLGGVLTLLSPCSVLLLPAFFAYTFVTPGRLAGMIAVFYLGLVLTLVPLGMAAGGLGSFVNEHRALLVTAMSLLVISLGLLQASGVKLSALRTSARPQGKSFSAVFVLGLVYGVAGVCSGPILGSVLAVAAFQGDSVRGGLLLAVYAAGMVLPLAIIAPFWERIGARRRVLNPRPITAGRIRTNSTNLVAGSVLVLVGTIFLLTEGTVGLIGVLTIDDQFAAENWARTVGAVVPDTTLIGVGLLLVVGALFFRRWRANRANENRQAASTPSDRP